MEKKYGKRNLSELRKRAEDLLTKRQRNLFAFTPEDTSELFHELQTYQIELELQNEELKIAHEELELSRSKYADLYDFAPVGYLTLSAKGIITEANLTVVDMLEEMRLMLLNQPLSRYIHQDDQDIFYKHRKILLDTNRKQSCELRLKKKGGSFFYALLECVLHENIDGVTGQFRVALTDITARKQAEDALLESLAEQQRLSAAIVQSNEMVIITDTEGRIEFVNPAFEKSTGYTLEEVVGENPRIIQSGKHGREFYQDLWNTIQRGEVWEGRLINKRKDGTLFTERASIAPIRNSAGDIVNYVSVKHDITDYLRISAQLEHAQKMESIGRLAGGVAHDINNMLTVVLGFSELLLDQMDEADPMSDDVHEIVSASKRSREVVRQLLAFARKEIIHPQVIDINTSIESCIRMLNVLIGENINLNWLPGQDLPPIKFDNSQLEQIISNLCINAKDAIADIGQITLETAEAHVDETSAQNYTECRPGSYIMLSISDTGKGIEESDLPSIFEPFFTTKDVDKGTGLGLATVYGIVKQNNCFIDVQSNVGEGTTFKIFIPTNIENSETIPLEKTDHKREPQGGNILVVDDDQAILRLVRKVLENSGYTLHPANSPKQALDFAIHPGQKIDLLITDVVMPEMNGNKLAKHINNLFPNIKTLFMSGYTEDKIGRYGVIKEDVNFIRKPFTSDEIASMVEKVMHDID